jgi:hypothetical protein
MKNERMYSATEVARDLRIPYSRFVGFMRSRVVTPDANVDAGRARVQLFRESSLPAIRKAVAAQSVETVEPARETLCRI